jgi:hypothetical protein
VVPAGLTELLRRGLGDVAGRTNARLRFVGYTRNERLERRTALVYEDDIGLSAARARRTMETIAAEMQLAPAQVEFEGRGYVHSDDVVNAGFVQGETSHVIVQVVYDEVAPLDTYDGVDVTPLTRELTPENAFALNLMRITVDGKPLDDKDRSSADVQRCTDVALQQADIQFGFDNLGPNRLLSPRAGHRRVLAAKRLVARPFHDYANYAHFIERRGRIFELDQSLGNAGRAHRVRQRLRRMAAEPAFAPARELRVLRAYGSGGVRRTVPQPVVAYRETEAPPPAGTPRTIVRRLPARAMRPRSR